MNAHHDTPSFWRSRACIALMVLGAVAGFFLLSEHWAHVLGAAPYLLVLACPLMHRRGVSMLPGHPGSSLRWVFLAR
jgi:hypothetical protein